jgi:phage terminase large subunit
VPHEVHSNVETFWDIGVGDSTAIIFAQRCGREIHIIDYYEAQGEGLQHYLSVIRSKAEANGWNYGDHYAPHDIEVREFSSGARTRLQIARDLGLKFQIVPNIPIIDGIELARGLFPRLWIDSVKCKHLIKAIENYQKSYNEKYNVYSDKPLHDWSSHAADSFRYMAVQYSRESSSTGRMTPEDAAAMEARYRIR